MLTTKEILTREEVMEILKIGRSTFYKLLQTGQLKGFKEGNRYKVPVESVEKYVEMRMRRANIIRYYVLYDSYFAIVLAATACLGVYACVYISDVSVIATHKYQFLSYIRFNNRIIYYEKN